MVHHSHRSAQWRVDLSLHLLPAQPRLPARLCSNGPDALDRVPLLQRAEDIAGHSVHTMRNPKPVLRIVLQIMSIKSIQVVAQVHSAVLDAWYPATANYYFDRAGLPGVSIFYSVHSTTSATRLLQHEESEMQGSG